MVPLVIMHKGPPHGRPSLFTLLRFYTEGKRLLAFDIQDEVIEVVVGRFVDFGYAYDEVITF